MVQLLWNDVARFVESFVTGMLLAVRSSYITNPNATGATFNEGEVLLPAPIYTAVPPTNGFVASDPDASTANPAAWTQGYLTDHADVADTVDGSQSSFVTIGQDTPETSHGVSDSSSRTDMTADPHGISTAPASHGSSNATDVVTLQDLQTVLMLLQNVLNRQASTITNIMSMVNQTNTRQTDSMPAAGSNSDQTWTLPVLGAPPADSSSWQSHSQPSQNPHLGTGTVGAGASYSAISAPPLAAPPSSWWQIPVSPALNVNTRPNSQPSSIPNAPSSAGLRPSPNGFLAPAVITTTNKFPRGPSFQATSGTIFSPNGEVAAFPSLGSNSYTLGSTSLNSWTNSNTSGFSGTSSPDSTNDVVTDFGALQQAGRCGIPVDAAGVQLRLQEFMGGWYEYLYRTPGFSPAYNVYNNYSALGYIYRRDAYSWMLAATSNVFMYLESPQSNGQLQCIGMFEQTNFTSDGQKVALSFYQNNPPVNFSYAILSTDYSNMGLLYRCNRPNTTTQLCDDPFFWVNTRVDPRTLSASSRTYIQSLVDNALQPYCYSSRDMVLTNWTNVPACAPPAPPQFTSFVQNLQSTSALSAMKTRDYRRIQFS
ncbi:hypothetical protein RvY_09906 [Ramazzottius varieornatus]|uniref:Lipocalin/cytosolic fatty-acid binding domain-containing protein n=1 Tax=Ramazzottius varieornatus TaxID=947166 RepID=A0A1D1VIS7_RAMVA|nr:hypothetical protein RvY_09906 [Ramazzottius varieornatus]